VSDKEFLMSEFTSCPQPSALRSGIVSSPIGDVVVIGSGRVLAQVHLPRPDGTAQPTDVPRDDDAVRPILEELEEYFAGARQHFSLDLAPGGTPFQQRVWAALCAIPYATTTTYGKIAEAAGNSKAARAVGMANNKNPIAIVIPCHRVIGASGKLVGYAGGLPQKQLLLDLEVKSS
jgi:methylated-DNA-[protein]-cysteine S-methyltransferase